jgi:hypothetical protein
MDSLPSPNGSNGRQSGGQFGPGNRFGRGNPHAHRVHVIQALIRDETTDDDLRAVWRRLLEMAKAGDLTAAKLVFDRVLGKVRDVEPEPPEPGENEPPRILMYMVCKTCGAQEEHKVANVQEAMQVELEQPGYLEAESAKLFEDSG